MKCISFVLGFVLIAFSLNGFSSYNSLVQYCSQLYHSKNATVIDKDGYKDEWGRYANCNGTKQHALYCCGGGFAGQYWQLVGDSCPNHLTIGDECDAYYTTVL